MEIIFYDNKSNHNIINKNIVELNSLEFKFKENVSVLNPNLILKNYDGGNYAFIPSLKRYYFIDDVILLKGNLYELVLSVDVLTSYKDDILENDFYSDSGDYTVVNSSIEFRSIYDNTKFLLIIGG